MPPTPSESHESRDSSKGPAKQQQEGEENKEKQQKAAYGGPQQQGEGNEPHALGGAAAPLLPEGGDSVAPLEQQEEQQMHGGGAEAKGEGEKAEAEMLEAAAAMTAEEDGEQKKQSDSFDIYNKGLTSLMTFDESGQPILVPLSDSAPAAAAYGLLPTSTTAAASDDTEGQYEAVPPPQGPCAGLCPPYGALPEQMPLLGTGKEKQAGATASEAVAKSGVPLAVAEAEAAGQQVVEEAGQLYIRKRGGRGISVFTLPSRTRLGLPLPSERTCPVPLWQHLPPSPFVNKEGVVGVDVCVVAEDLGAPECRDAIPLYDFEAVTEAAAVAGRDLEPLEQRAIKRRTGDENFFKRLDTLMKSQRKPTAIALD